MANLIIAVILFSLTFPLNDFANHYHWSNSLYYRLANSSKYILVLWGFFFILKALIGIGS